MQQGKAERQRLLQVLLPVPVFSAEGAGLQMLKEQKQTSNKIRRNNGPDPGYF